MAKINEMESGEGPRHKTIGVSLHPELRGRATERAARLGLSFSRYVALCLEAELAGRIAGLLPGEPLAAANALPPDDLDLDDAIARGGEYAAVKSRAINFEDDLEAILKNAGVSYKRTATVAPWRLDFLVETRRPGLDRPQRWILECRTQIRQRYTVTLGQCVVLRSLPGFDGVLLVIPYLKNFAPEWRETFAAQGIRVVTPDTLLDELARA